MLSLNPAHLALVTRLRDQFPHTDFVPEAGPSLVVTVHSLVVDAQVVARVERSAVGDRIVYLLEPR